MTKEDVARAYADWYSSQLMERSGCGGPVLMAGIALAVVMYLIL